MAKPISEKMVNTLLGGVAILVVLGLAGVMYFKMTSVADRTPNIKQYDTSVIEKHMLVTNKEDISIFDRTIFLKEYFDPNSPATHVQSEKELGKFDITKSE